jgi:putative oxidoreductase
MESSAAVDAALTLLRVVAGVTMFLHGANKVKGGLAGVGGWFASMGMRPGALHARLAAFTEIGAGLLLAVGLLTPFAGAGFVGLMAVAGWVAHRKVGFFVFHEGQGWEYVLVLGTIGAALGGTGAGRWSLDHALDPTIDPGPGLAISLGGGLAAAIVLLAACYRPGSGTVGG